jgi:hypothetical protein
MKLLDLPSSSVLERNDSPGIKRLLQLWHPIVPPALQALKPNHLVQDIDKILYHYFLWGGLVCLSKN